MMAFENEDIPEDKWLLYKDEVLESYTRGSLSRPRKGCWVSLTHTRSYVWPLYLLLLHAAVFLSLAAITINLEHTGNLMQHRFLPAPGSIKYYQSFQFALGHGDTSPYSGDPTSKNEAAWQNLTVLGFFGLSNSEMREAGQDLNTSIRVAEDEGGGYLATMEVYHELHCIRQLRMFLYQDYYYPDGFTAANTRYLHGHLGHCLETLRMASMCRVDTSLRTFSWEEQWDGGLPKPSPKTSASRGCVDWDKFHSAVQSRALSFDPNLILPDGRHQKTSL